MKLSAVCHVVNHPVDLLDCDWLKRCVKIWKRLERVTTSVMEVAMVDDVTGESSFIRPGQRTECFVFVHIRKRAGPLQGFESQVETKTRHDPSVPSQKSGSVWNTT